MLSCSALRDVVGIEARHGGLGLHELRITVGSQFALGHQQGARELPARYRVAGERTSTFMALSPGCSARCALPVGTGAAHAKNFEPGGAAGRLSKGGFEREHGSGIDRFAVLSEAALVTVLAEHERGRPKHCMRAAISRRDVGRCGQSPPAVVS
jgi:hypothetical protein